MRDLLPLSISKKKGAGYQAKRNNIFMSGQTGNEYLPIYYFLFYGESGAMMS